MSSETPRPRAKVTQIHRFAGHREAVYALAPAPDPYHFFTAGGDGVVAEWSMLEGTNVRGVLQAGVPVYALGRARTSTADWLFVGLNDGGVHFVNLTDNRLVRSVQLHRGAVFDFLWLPTSQRLLVLSADGSFSAWNLDPIECVVQAQVCAASLRAAALSPDGTWIALGASDACIRLYAAADLQPGPQWAAHLNSVFCLGWHSHGLLSGSRDARLKSWTAAGEPLHEVVAHLFALNDIELHPGGRFFATGSMDKTIKLWEAESLRLIKVIDRARLDGHSSSVNRVLWLDAGRLLVSVSDDRQVLGWAVDFEG